MSTKREEANTGQTFQMVRSTLRPTAEDDREQHAKKRRRTNEQIQARKEAHVKRIEALKNTKADILLAFRKVEHITACMERDGCTEFVGKSPQEVLRMVNAAPQPEIMFLDPADVARNDEQLNDDRIKDTDNIRCGHASVSDMEQIPSTAHPEYPYVFNCAPSEW